MNNDNENRAAAAVRCAAQGMIEALPNAIFFTDAAGHFRGVNAAWESLFGLTREAVLGRTAEELFADLRELSGVARPLASVPRSEAAAETFETRIRAADGSKHDVVCYRRATGCRGASTKVRSGPLSTSRSVDAPSDGR